MTRRSRRELERAIEDLEERRRAVSLTDLYGDGSDVTVSWVEYDDTPAPDEDVTAQFTVVMRRERAEREGREILGPADGPGDLVRVPSSDS